MRAREPLQTDSTQLLPYLSITIRALGAMLKRRGGDAVPLSQRAPAAITSWEPPNISVVVLMLSSHLLFTD